MYCDIYGTAPKLLVIFVSCYVKSVYNITKSNLYNHSETLRDEDVRTDKQMAMNIPYLVSRDIQWHTCKRYPFEVQISSHF